MNETGLGVRDGFSSQEKNFELTQLPFPVIPRTDSNIEAQTVASKKRASLKRALPIGKGRMRPITQDSS